MWKPEGTTERYPLCDLVCVYYAPGTVTCVELKGSRDKRRRAAEQLLSGERFARDVLHATRVTKKFVVYSSRGYACEVI